MLKAFEITQKQQAHNTFLKQKRDYAQLMAQTSPQQHWHNSGFICLSFQNVLRPSRKDVQSWD